MKTLFENQSIPLEDLPGLSETAFNALEKWYKAFLHLRNSLIIMLLVSCTILFHWLNEVGHTTCVVISSLYIFFAVLFVYSAIIVELGFKRKAFLLREHDLLYKSGYIMQKMTAIPKNRIQHVEIRQGILLRLFRLSKLVIFTAGGSGSDLSISGLKPEIAEQLKEHLSLSISEHE